MLITLAQVKLIPGLPFAASAIGGFTDEQVTAEIAAASAAIKSFVKRDLELTTYADDIYSGSGREDLWLRQWPIQFVISVHQDATAAYGQAAAAFPADGLLARGESYAVEVDRAAPALPTAASITSRTFPVFASVLVPAAAMAFTVAAGLGYAAGVLLKITDDGGSGFMYAKVSAYVTTTLTVLPIFVSGTGTSAAWTITPVPTSNRGMLRRLGGGVASDPWFFGRPETYAPGKLSAFRKPYWPRGDGNLKVSYVAGYSPLPDDLVYAAGMLVAWMLRYQGAGHPLQSESFENYSYSLMSGSSGGDPELGRITQTLKTYREVSLGNF